MPATGMQATIGTTSAPVGTTTTYAYGSSPSTQSNSTNLSPEMKTFYDKTLLENAKPKLVHEQWAQSKSIPAGNGKTIEFRRFNKLPVATSALTEGVTPDAGNLRVDAVTASISQFGYYIKLTDLLQLTAIDPVLAETVKLLGQQAGETRDIIMRNIMAQTTNVVYCSKWNGSTESAVSALSGIDATAKLTVKEIQKASTKLRANNIDTIDGSYICIVHPHVAFDLKRDAEFVEWSKYTTPDKMYEGEIGKIDNVRIVETTNALITKDGGSSPYIAVYHNFVFGANAYAKTDVNGGVETIVKQLGAGDDPLNQRSTAGWKMNMGGCVLATEALIDVRSCGSYSSTDLAN